MRQTGRARARAAGSPEAPGFTATPAVINGFSDLILELWGPEAGSHARSAVGMAELPYSIPVEIEAEVAIDG
jgi:enamine deaminase RidA (YjgF/YER057c/UK114 family)